MFSPNGVEQSDIIHLALVDQEYFIKALLSPPEPVLALKRAFENKKKLLPFSTIPPKSTIC